MKADIIIALDAVCQRELADTNDNFVFQPAQIRVHTHSRKTDYHIIAKLIPSEIDPGDCKQIIYIIAARAEKTHVRLVGLADCPVR